MASAAHTSRPVEVSEADICKTRWNAVVVVVSSVDLVLLFAKEVVDLVLVLEDGADDVGGNISPGKYEFIYYISLCTNAK